MACTVIVLIVFVISYQSFPGARIGLVAAIYSAADEKAILEQHNAYRTNVYPGASNMLEMVWDSGLAIQAQDWADKCIYEHPNRIEYQDYANIGQNLFIQYPDASGTNAPSPVTEPVTEWYNEEKYYNLGGNSCTKFCGHYTQVVWATTGRVGCGIKFCPAATNTKEKMYTDAWIVVCNYSPSGNYVGKNPYFTGKPCVACPVGTMCKNKLCTTTANCQGDDSGCECLIDCQNGGTKNAADCTCDCPQGYFGSYCEAYCKNVSGYCNANPGWPESWCVQYSFVRKGCPKMCKVCTV